MSISDDDEDFIKELQSYYNDEQDYLDNNGARDSFLEKSHVKKQDLGNPARKCEENLEDESPVEIDMDINIDMDSDTEFNKTIALQNKSKSKSKSKTTLQQLLSPADSDEDIIIPIKSKKKTITFKKNIEVPKTYDKPTTSPDTSQTKLTKTEANFEINQETIEYFSKDLEPIKIFTKRSPFPNNYNTTTDTKFINSDTRLICLLLKCKLIEDYKCNTPKCKVKHLWNGKPIQLLLNRKNGIHNDLSISNLEFICANCYMTTYGLEMFKKKAKQAILNCDNCGFPMVNFANSRKKAGICLACEKKMSNMSYEKVQSSYYNKLQEVYSENPLLSDDIHRPRHFKDVAKYKKKTTGSAASKQKDSKGSKDSNDSTTNIPIIELDMSIPDISDVM